MSLAGDSSWFSCILTLAFEQQQQGKASLKCGKQLRPHVAVINQPEKCIRGFQHNDVNTAGKSNFQWNITCNWKFDFDEIIAIPPSTFKELLKMGPAENIQRILLNSTLTEQSRGVCVIPMPDFYAFIIIIPEKVLTWIFPMWCVLIVNRVIQDDCMFSLGCAARPR